MSKIGEIEFGVGKPPVQKIKCRIFLQIIFMRKSPLTVQIGILVHIRWNNIRQVMSRKLHIAREKYRACLIGLFRRQVRINKAKA